MALHDIDKQSDDRANPKLNSDDNVSNRMSHETNSTTYRTAGSGVNQGLVFQQGIIQSYDANNLRNLFFGYDPSINATRPVLRVAKDGFDARTTTAANLIFNSEQNVFKIVDSGTITLTALVTANPGVGLFGFNSVTNVYQHNLGYVPAFVTYMLSAGVYLQMPYAINNIISTTQVKWKTVSATADTTNLYINTQTTVYGVGDTTIFDTVKFYLLQEAAN